VSLARAKGSLERMAVELERILDEDFDGVTEPVACMAEGLVHAAHASAEQAAELLTAAVALEAAAAAMPSRRTS